MKTLLPCAVAVTATTRRGNDRTPVLRNWSAVVRRVGSSLHCSIYTVRDLRVLNEQCSRLDHRAMFAEANMRPCYFRYGYDITIPLLASSFFYDVTDTAPQDRKYFATFKVSYDNLSGTQQ